MATTGDTIDTPFQHIAVSLSGGGARAVGYHLGTLDYLHRSGLLEHVRILSTVSGGTLVGASYILAKQEETSFQDLFVDFFEFFPSVNMFEGILEILDRKNARSLLHARKISTAFAELYHERFFSHYFEEPYFGAIDVREGSAKHHVQDLIFNATEFETGIAFRFQKSHQACKIGNGNVWIDAPQANEMRIADVVSASSCIPGGFEPFSFPADFHWPDVCRYGTGQSASFEPVRLQARTSATGDNLALMDGGVYDNQGITSVLLAISRRTRATGERFEDAEHHDPQAWGSWAHDLLTRFSIVDLYIVSDTPLSKDSLYTVAGDSRSATSGLGRWLQNRTLGDINRYAATVAIVLVISALASIARLSQTGQLRELTRHLSQGIQGYAPLLYESIATLVPLLVAGLLGIIMFSLRAKLNRAMTGLQSRLPKFEHPPWYYLKQLRISDLLDMLRQRASSMMALSADIYMHRIRQLGYGILFGHRELIPTVMTNEIYAIASADAAAGLPPQCDPPSPSVRAIVRFCAGMPTKASFDTLSPRRLDSDRLAGADVGDNQSLLRRRSGETRTDLDLLTACGQLSTCFNLVRYLHDKLDADGAGNDESAGLRSLLDAACADWNRLQEDPFRFLDERLEKGRSSTHAAKLAAIAARKAGHAGSAAGRSVAQ